MKTKDFYFDLPESLIAQHPLKTRNASKMLAYSRATKQIVHTAFSALPDYLSSGDLLVFNNSKVIPARIYGKKATGGQVELLVERILSPRRFLAHIRASKAPKAGSLIVFDKGYELHVQHKAGHLYTCEMNHDLLDALEAIGHIPLPPYITRQATEEDKHRYQTVYAKVEGSVAAPTAGLHFDEAMFETLKAKGVEVAYSTLHVGAGTFQPVRSESIHDHQMHAEYLEISPALCEKVNQTKEKGGRVIAVGSTALRALETAAKEGKLYPFEGETQIFITPGYTFQLIDGLVTNFHLPESTLLMMVSAFLGYEATMSLYQTAVEHQYRFFSYGDVSLLL